MPETPEFVPRPDLQVYLLFAREGFSVDSAKISEKLNLPLENRWDWEALFTISIEERKGGIANGETSSSSDVWFHQLQIWEQSVSKNPAYKKQLAEIWQILGVTDMNNMIVQGAFGNYANAPKGEGIRDLVTKLVSFTNPAIYGPLMRMLAAGLYGQHLSGEIVTQIVLLESQIKNTKSIGVGVEQLTQTLLASIQPVAGEPKEITSIRMLLEKAKTASPQTTPPQSAVVSSSNTGVEPQVKEISQTKNMAKLIYKGAKPEQQNFGIIVEKDLPQDIKTMAIVSDGFGENGATASKTAATVFLKEFTEIMKANPLQEIGSAISIALDKAHAEILGLGVDSGTTFVASIQNKDMMHFVNVGNARGYVLSQGGDINQMTIDHVVSPGTPVIMRSLGDNDRLPHEASISSQRVSQDDMVMLCSASAVSLLTIDQIKQRVFSKTPEQAIDELFSVIKNSQDNIIVTVQKVTV